LTDTGRYHVRALDRSLAILRMLNQHNGLVAAELSRLVDLPRPTVLRLLNTLSDAGYVMRSESDGRYRATRRLRELSCGYEEETWLRNVVQPFLAELEGELVWPLAVIRLYGTSLRVEALTDQRSQMILRRDSAGIEVSPLASSCGYLYMALLSPIEGQEFLAHAIAEGTETLRRLEMSVEDVLERVDATRRNGHAVLHLAGHSALTVPVRIDGELFCGLNMRMYGSIEARRIMLEDYVEDLYESARVLGERIAQMGSIPAAPPVPRVAVC
jgi:IclR family mhp operon transcriptional activator